MDLQNRIIRKWMKKRKIKQKLETHYAKRKIASRYELTKEVFLAQ